jgi:hypothetical protein
MTSAAVITSDRMRTSPATGNRLSAAPIEDRAVEANPVCTAHKRAQGRPRAPAAKTVRRIRSAAGSIRGIVSLSGRVSRMQGMAVCIGNL